MKGKYIFFNRVMNDLQDSESPGCKDLSENKMEVLVCSNGYDFSEIRRLIKYEREVGNG